MESINLEDYLNEIDKRYTFKIKNNLENNNTELYVKIDFEILFNQISIVNFMLDMFKMCYLEYNSESKFGEIYREKLSTFEEAFNYYFNIKMLKCHINNYLEASLTNNKPKPLIEKDDIKLLEQYSFVNIEINKMLKELGFKESIDVISYLKNKFMIN